jgi:hypothetical protein
MIFLISAFVAGHNPAIPIKRIPTTACLLAITVFP